MLCKIEINRRLFAISIRLAIIRAFFVLIAVFFADMNME